jgi:hypothetical protein
VAALVEAAAKPRAQPELAVVRPRLRPQLRLPDLVERMVDVVAVDAGGVAETEGDYLA